MSGLAQMRVAHECGRYAVRSGKELLVVAAPGSQPLGCLAAKATSFFKTSYGTPPGIARPLMNNVGVELTSIDFPSATECSTRVVVSGLAAHAAMSAPFTPVLSARAVSFSSALAGVISFCDPYTPSTNFQNASL